MMGRAAVWVVGTGVAALVLFATPASAQVHVDVGVYSPRVGARVIVGPPPIYVVDRYYDPYRYGRYPRWDRRRDKRDDYRDLREARHEYEKDRREAEREYWKDRREAEREYWKDVREARREYEKDRREARRDRRW